MRSATFALVFLLTSPLGCGSVHDGGTDGGGGGGGGGGDFTLSADPTSLSIPYRDSQTTTLTIERTGDTGDISLSADNLPAGITATFDPNPVPAGTDSVDVTVSVEPGATAGDNQVTVTGSAGDKNKDVTLDVTVETVSVSGHVVGNASGVTVVLVGQPAVTSDADGNFSFTDVSLPYDIYSVSTGFGPTTVVNYYKGLTRLDPVVTRASATLVVVPRGRTGTIAGAMSGGSADQTKPWVIAWGDTSGKTDTFINTAGSYFFDASWPSTAATKQGTLYGLQWAVNASGEPSSYVRYGQKVATLTADQQTDVYLLAADVDTSVQAASLTGRISPPVGYSPPTFTLTQQLGSNSHVLWTGSVTNIDAKIPLVAAGTSALYAVASQTDATSEYVIPGLAADTDVTFAMPAAAVLSSPADGATGVDTTTPFALTAPDQAVSLVQISTGGTTRVSYQIFTTGSQLTIPDLAEVPVPPNQSFSVRILGYGPLSSVDDVATDAGAPGMSTAEFTGTPHFHTTSLTTTFTSAP